MEKMGKVRDTYDFKVLSGVIRFKEGNGKVVHRVPNYGKGGFVYIIYDYKNVFLQKVGDRIYAWELRDKELISQMGNQRIPYTIEAMEEKSFVRDEFHNKVKGMDLF